MIAYVFVFFFFLQEEDGIRDKLVTGVQTCALPISIRQRRSPPQSFPSFGFWTPITIFPPRCALGTFPVIFPLANGCESRFLFSASKRTLSINLILIAWKDLSSAKESPTAPNTRSCSMNSG